MNSINKKSPGARDIPQPFKPQAGHAPQFKPAVAQLKTGVSAQSVKRPVAPPVYRPQSGQKIVQPKTAHPAQLNRNPPIAPPVYRPQPVPRVLQTKQAASVSTARPNITGRTPNAPSVFKPNNSPAVMRQRNFAGGGQGFPKQNSSTIPKPPAQASSSNSIQRQRVAGAQPARVSAIPPARVATSSVIQRYTLVHDRKTGFRGKRSENGRYITGHNLSEVYVFPGNAVERSYRTQEVVTIEGTDYEVWKPSFNVIEDCVAAMEEILHGVKLKYGVPDASEYRDPIGTSKKRKAFGESDERNRKRGKFTDLGEDANPGILEGYVIARQSYKRDEERPQFHGASVVAQDGNDDITLEATAPEQGEISPNRVQPVYDMYQRGKKGKKSFKYTYKAEYGKDATVSVVRPVKNLPKKAFARAKSKKIINF